MCVVQQLLRGLGMYVTLTVCWATLGFTFVAATISCFVECTPFQYYWVVSPNVGTCAAGNIQLLVFSILEILTDLMLMALPMRQLIRIQRPWLARLRLILLFMVGTTVIAVTLARLLLNQLQLHRTGPSHNIANVEIFAAAVVANAPAIYGLFHLKSGSRVQGSNASYGTSASRQRTGVSLALSSMSKRQEGPVGTWKKMSVSNETPDNYSDEELVIVSLSPSGA